MEKKILITMTLIFAMTSWALSQERIIRGTVTAANDGIPLKGVTVQLKGQSVSTQTDRQGKYILELPVRSGVLVFSLPGFQKEEIKIGLADVINALLYATRKPEVITESRDEEKSIAPYKKYKTAEAPMSYGLDYRQQPELQTQDWNTEEYNGINENIFHAALQNPLSTFSIDVDVASYSNIRRYINDGQRPPKDAVRIEEMINYFNYDYEQPRGNDPFSIYTEISTAPWNSNHKLVHIGLQGKKIPTENLPPTNLVFLIDVSGSMGQPNKLPLLKSSFKLLTEQLRQQDCVSIVVYAGAAGLVLPPTSGVKKNEIIEALDNLQAGGSTAGGAGIQLAYKVAKENFKEGGNNRVIIATDGDFNIGESSNAAMERLIEQKKEDGIFLTVLGFGMGNYKDSKMEILADKGNGNYAYIDNILEAQKVLVNEFGGTLFTIAKDVKLQVEFNPSKVQAYRLIGYENRMLQNEDFNNDKKDAGELGSGHTVTALYEIIPVGVQSKYFSVDPLKYQNTSANSFAQQSRELMTIKFRYKEPTAESSKLITHSLIDKNIPIAKTSENFRWSAAVAGFGMILRESEYVEDFSITQALELAKASKGQDIDGYRQEFINLVKSQGILAKK